MANIIVIGAGIAGLKAALDLAISKHSVTLLEARERLGGRIHTVKASDNQTPIELGASYWEGIESSPFYQHYFSQTSDDPSKPYVRQFNEADAVLVDLNHPIKMALPGKEIASYYQLANETLKNTTTTRLGKNFQQFIDEIDLPKDKIKAKWVKKIIELQSIHQSTPLTKIGFPDFKIPPIDTALNAYTEGDANFNFVANGYHRVIYQIAKQCKEAGVNIITNCAVSKITDSQNGVTVQTSQGFFQAKKLVCTIPLGVLKTQAKTLFTIPLSQEKIEAISAMGVHASTRVVLEFAQPFWDKPLCPYILLCDANNPGMKEFRNNFALHGKAILQTPSYANEALHLSDSALIDQIVSELQFAFPQKAIPVPKYYIVHRWSTDPYAQGAYPYRTLQMDEKNHQALEKAEGNIYFAGADFSRHGFSVQHAYASGQYVAAQLNHSFHISP